MSAQPYRYVKDIENFRNEYMNALSLRANIDDMNFQANKIYTETGALPPKSTMKDMRTTAEILMDVEKLKTHGGSLRITVVKMNSSIEVNELVLESLEIEKQYDPLDFNIMSKFQKKAQKLG